ncbi:transmembrane protein 247 isoform X1 [Ochotona princeps]|uniref:transmembrane protein 247 isoform X1 n=1 Tax=Ochotona princeps TaxID=9978 RepID=UPI00271552A2|nr:transmembrane protein 247 isoform X1 [Ochotona princeps]
MATEDREKMEGRGAGESCPHFPKSLQGEPVPEGKPRASVEAESLKPGSSYDHLEEMEICEDAGCPGQPKAGPTTKGQAGDGPEAVELAPTSAPAPGVESKAEVELEKMRMEFELTRLKYLHAENERQRQHQQAMERLQQQVAVRQVWTPTCPRADAGKDRAELNPAQSGSSPGVASSTVFFPPQFQGGLQDLLLPQNQFAMFLYCFIFIHTIYVTKEMVFFLFSKHYLFCIAAILLCLIKTLWSYFQLFVFSTLGTTMPVVLGVRSKPVPALPAPVHCTSLLLEPALKEGSAASQ